MLSVSPTSLSRGMKIVALAASSIMEVTPLALRLLSSPSKENGSVAKTSVGTPRSSIRFAISTVAPPPVPPPSAATTTANLTPSRCSSMFLSESSAARRAWTTSPPEPCPASLSPPRRRNGADGLALDASVSATRQRMSPAKARMTPCAIAAPAVPTPTRSMGDVSFI